jgi:hypothetical protein
MIAIAVAGFGLSIEASTLLKEGHSANAASLKIASNGLFGAMPMMWGLGTISTGFGNNKGGRTCTSNNGLDLGLVRSWDDKWNVHRF